MRAYFRFGSILAQVSQRCVLTSPLRRSIGVLCVHDPIAGIVEDVLADGVQFVVVTDDVLVVIALPDWLPRRAS